jgi:hypothetical protein
VGVFPDEDDSTAKAVEGTRVPDEEHHQALTATWAVPYGSETRVVTVTALEPTERRVSETAVVVAREERLPFAGNWDASPPKSETSVGPGAPYWNQESPFAASIEYCG